MPKLKRVSSFGADLTGIAAVLCAPLHVCCIVRTQQSTLFVELAELRY